MIWFLHGKNPLLIQNNIQEILKKGNYSERIEIQLENQQLDYFSNACTTQNMFGGKIIVIVSLDKSSDEEIIKYLEISQKSVDNTDILFYVEKNLSPKGKILGFIKELSSIKILEVKEEKDWSIFNFADAAFEGNVEKSHALLKSLELRGENSVTIHSILSNHLRNISRVKFRSEIKLTPFVLSKIQRQASKFSEGGILELYKYFYEMDRNLKTGEIPENVANIMVLKKILDVREK